MFLTHPPKAKEIEVIGVQLRKIGPPVARLAIRIGASVRKALSPVPKLMGDFPNLSAYCILSILLLAVMTVLAGWPGLREAVGYVIILGIVWLASLH